MITITSLIKESIQPILSKAGFRKKSLVWNRKRLTLIDVFTFQKSKGSEANCIQFTINAGIFVPELYELVWGQQQQGMIGEADCSLLMRVGPPKNGDWWNITSDTDIDQVKSELISQYYEYAEPFWDNIVSLENVNSRLRELGDIKKQYWLIQLYTVIASYLTGDKEFALTAVNELCSSKNLAISEKAKSVKKGLGI